MRRGSMGCVRHEHLLSGTGSQGVWGHVRNYRHASRDCVWDGRRVLDLTLGLDQDMLRNINRANGVLLRETFATRAYSAP